MYYSNFPDHMRLAVLMLKDVFRKLKALYSGMIRLSIVVYLN